MKRVTNFVTTILPIHIIQILTNLLPNSSFTIRLRGALIKPFLGKAGKGLKIASGVNIIRPELLTVGENVYFAHNTWINATGRVHIGSNVMLGPMSVIASSNHVIRNRRLTSESVASPIQISSDVWLGSHVVVTSGTTIGSGSVIAAGAVVTKSLDGGAMYAGTPARYTRSIIA